MRVNTCDISKFVPSSITNLTVSPSDIPPPLKVWKPSTADPKVIAPVPVVAVSTFILLPTWAYSNPYDGSGIPTSKASRLNVFPDVTDCEAVSEPVTNNLELVVSVIA